MKTFYSILNLYIRPEIEEKLSLGMLLVDGSKVRFEYSRNKLKHSKNFISKATYRAVTNYLKYVQDAVSSNEIINNSQEIISLKDQNKYNRMFSVSYIEYLSRYNNNVLTFSEPKLLDVDVKEDIYMRMFKKLIDENAFHIKERTSSKIDRIKKEFYPKMKPHFSIEKTIDSTLYSGLLTPLKLDLLGKNDVEVFGQSIDFNKKVKALENSIGSLIHLHQALPDALQFVIGYEPEKNKEINHRIWNNVRTHKNFEYVDISEVDRIADYAEKHSLLPLFGEEPY